jgi:amino acid adenylation domain-containing protein
MPIPATSRHAPFSRPISLGEWWILATPYGRAVEVQFCVEGDGSIDPDALADALATAAEACPSARLVRDGQRWVDSGRPPRVRLAEAASFDRGRLDSELLRTRLGEAGEPGCEVLLVRGAPATVVFRAHHSVMDGVGALFWLRQVFRALRGEAVATATAEPSREQLMTEIMARLGRGLPPGPRPAAAERPSLLGHPSTTHRRSLWRRRTVQGTHPAVTAKLARLLAAYAGGHGRIEIPVDLRQDFPGLRTTSAALGVVTLVIGPDEDWNDVNARLLGAIADHEYLGDISQTGLLDIPLPALRTMRSDMDDTVRQQARTGLLASVSHLGAVDLADLCAGGFEATACYSLGCVGFEPELNVVESTGRTELTLSWYDGPDVAERAEALLDWIAGELSPPAHADWDGNRTARPAPPATLTGLFAEQAGRTPDAVAISGEDGQLSYAELGRRSAAVAAALHDRGIGRGDVVGLVAGRSAAAIAAIWGILRSGAAYLPIDAGYPPARITRLLTDAAARVCLLECGGADDSLPPGCAGLDLAGLWAGSVRPGWAGAPVRPDDLACVIYTSGSTGAPKGVQIEHRSLVNYVRWATREAGIGPSTRMPLIASLSFDMAGCAIFLPLLAGGTVLPVREVNAVTLHEAIVDRGATALALTPSHLDLITMSGICSRAVRVVMTAGELLRRSTAARAREAFGPRCRILCQWGPTETTIVNTSHEFDPAADTGPGVPFGRPMDNNTVYLMDTHGRPVPPGTPGEAYVGGIQVARGYLARPDLTRQRFVILADGTRAYRTGDIARLLPDGELAFVSRIDDQIKVAGHRIEPAEIAQALEDHPAVRQAAVIPRSRPGQTAKELCGYVVADPGTTPAALRQHLAEQLPGYMVPAAIVAVPAIPRTANGKTDASRLPDPFTQTAAASRRVPGRDGITSAVAEIWAKTLQLDPHLIDDHTDFRELGGNSMLMLSMIDEVNRSLLGGRREEFLGQFGQIIREPTLGRISEFARQVLADGVP